MEILNDIYVINESRFIYKIVSFYELGSTEFLLNYNLELVAGFDYINPDENNAQGFISANMFVDYVQTDNITVFPLSESLGDRLKEEGYKVININDYKIHEIKLVEEN